MNRFRPFVFGLALSLAAAPAAQALTIEFDYSFDLGNFFAAGSLERTALEEAGAWYENNLTDSLTAIGHGPGQFDTYSARFSNPSQFNAGLTELEPLRIDNFSVAADTVRIFVGAVDLDPFGGGTLGVAGPGSFSVNGSLAYQNAMASRGQGASGVFADIFGLNANDFALWGGSLSIDNDRTWHSDPYTLPTGGRPDLFSVLLHELGHVFGIGTSASWANQLNAAQNRFLGPDAVASFGADVPTQAGGAHWVNGTQSLTTDDFVANGIAAGLLRETAFDPSLNLGTRKVLTELDVAGLRDVGWVIPVTAVPLPPAGWLFCGALAWLLRARRTLAA
ncbi:MAG: peptidase M10A and M12B matrixin and adamalysin [Gammaproteobacteria bacterium]